MTRAVSRVVGSPVPGSVDDAAVSEGAAIQGSKIVAATAATAGAESAADKSKLDGLASGAAALGTALALSLGAAAAGTAANASHEDHVHPTTGLALSTTTISAGNGLSGGGSLAANRSLSVAAADATITVAAGGISVATPLTEGNVRTALAASTGAITTNGQTLSIGTAALLTAGGVSLGAAPASAGAVRLSSAGAIKSRNNAGAADVSIAITDASDNLTFGEHVNVGGTTAVDAKTTLALQVGGANVLALSSSAITASQPINAGANNVSAAAIVTGNGHPATIGAVRFAEPGEQGTFLAFRKNDNSADVSLLSVDTGGTVTFNAQNQVNFQCANGTTVFNFSTSACNLSVPAMKFDQFQGTPTISQATKTADAAPQNMVVAAQAPFASATGANRNPGNLTLQVAAPAAGGATGSLKLQVSGSDVITLQAAALGFFGGAPATKPTVTGSRVANAALASLLTALAGFGLVTDSSTA